MLDGILAREGESRQTLGRERYLERMRAFVDDDPGQMLGQQRRVGASADWGRLRYTMDDGSARAVRVAFERLYRDGLAYRTEALVNWCPGCRTSVSDLEVIPTPETGTLWSVRYHLIDEATGLPDVTRRRPSPSRRRARRRSWATPRWPSIPTTTATGRWSGDASASRSSSGTCRSSRTTSSSAAFGTGAVKITPAHDHDDHATGQRHGLAARPILADDATVAGTGTDYDGLDRYEARRRIVADLEARGDLAGRARPRDGRSGAASAATTWWNRASRPSGSSGRHRSPPVPWTRPAQVAMRILPDRFEKTWEHWLTTIRDWNV